MFCCCLFYIWMAPFWLHQDWHSLDGTAICSCNILLVLVEQKSGLFLIIPKPCNRIKIQWSDLRAAKTFWENGFVCRCLHVFLTGLVVVFFSFYIPNWGPLFQWQRYLYYHLQCWPASHLKGKATSLGMQYTRSWKCWLLQLLRVITGTCLSFLSCKHCEKMKYQESTFVDRERL